ncbi:hypothetical protein YC2023_008135 [Brassica napus]
MPSQPLSTSTVKAPKGFLPSELLLIETHRRIQIRPKQSAGAHPARGSNRKPRPRLSPSLQHRNWWWSSRDQSCGVSLSGRGNLIVEYPGSVPGKILSFVGMHMDVVTANPDEWEFDPFSLSIDGDKLRGRGTTDCHGHVALVTELMKRLGETKPALKSSVVAVFIASEENSSIPGVGVDMLGFLISSNPDHCFGLIRRISSRVLERVAINAMVLGMEGLKEIQSRFYRDFPPHPQEKVYGFATPSTMKPTQWSYPGGGINQIPGECTVSGDVRLTPFYDVKEVMKKLQELTLSFDEASAGVACNLDSRGYHVLCNATKEVVGHVKPYSITGTLPLIRDLKDEGFDVQTSGYGLMATYHAKNEYCLLTDMCQGFDVFVRIISQLEQD